jgi:hypothetical protein
LQQQTRNPPPIISVRRRTLERTRTEVTTPLPNVTETTVQSILHIGDNATLVRYVSESVLYPAPVDRLVFSATVPRASICVSKGKNDTLVIDLNHERYMIKPASAKQIIEIHTRHGDDTIYIADTISAAYRDWRRPRHRSLELGLRHH